VGWAISVAPLAEDHQVLAVDVIGTLGRSVQTRPIDGTEDLAVWFRDLLDGLEVERAHIIGYSEGGFVALHAALGNADRLATVVAIDAAGTVERIKPRFLASMAWAGIKAAVGVPDALREFGQRMTPGVTFPDLWWDLVTTGAKGFRHALPMPKKVSDKHLRRLTTPALLYMAGNSEVYDARKAAERARALMPDVEIVIVEGARHGVPFTHPDRTWADIVDFIDRHEPHGNTA
jgi:pimeloyl-ACP methyl ester carboxylesterase